MYTMMQSANNGHPPAHAAHLVPGAVAHGQAPHPGAAAAAGHHHPPPHAATHPHLDPRYMDYATMHHLGAAAAATDPHALHYAGLTAPQPAVPVAHNSQGGQQLGIHGGGGKRNADSAGLDHFASSDEDGSMDVKPPVGSGGRGQGKGGGSGGGSAAGDVDAAGKKTRGRVKIKMEFIDNKLRRYTTFSKRKTGIMKKVRFRPIGLKIVFK